MNIPEIQYEQNEDGTWKAAFLAEDMTTVSHTDATAYKAVMGLVRPLISKTILALGKPEKTSHSSKGKYWVRHEETKEVVLITKEQLPLYVGRGFVPGRKLSTDPKVEQKAA